MTPLVDATASPSPARVSALPAPTTASTSAVLARREQLAALERDICELAGHIAAATCRWLLLVAKYDRMDGWREHGLRSCAEWLSWRCGFGLRAAQEHVRVARLLVDLPLTQKAFAAGRLSYAKVRAITRAESPQIEAELVQIAEHATGAQVERLVAGYRRAGRLMAAEQAGDNYIRWEYDADGSVLIRARLTSTDGATFIKRMDQAAKDLLGANIDSTANGAGPEPGSALKRERSAERSYPQVSDRERSAERSYPQVSECLLEGTRFEAERSTGRFRSAAFMHLISGSPTEPSESERSLVLIHVDARTILSGTAQDNALCELDSGWAIPPEAARKLSCDADLVTLVVDDRGRALDVGRKRRTVSRRLDRALRTRDRRCRFPGCNAPVHAWHHIKHWADGGPTDRANLIGLCRFHHHEVHDRGFVISTTGHETFRFVRPDGQPIPDVPPATSIEGALEDGHRHLDINEWTITGHWSGDKLHLHEAVWALYHWNERATASDQERMASSA